MRVRRALTCELTAASPTMSSATARPNLRKEAAARDSPTSSAGGRHRVSYPSVPWSRSTLSRRADRLKEVFMTTKHIAGALALSVALLGGPSLALAQSDTAMSNMDHM